MEKRLFIAKPIAEELKIFEANFANSVRSNNQRIQEIIDYMMRSDGKKIRPILLLLAAKASGDVNDVTYNSAITLELLHTASLIHDDVVDESLLRRGRPSLNAVYDNKVAVLAGDYYLSTALIKSVMTGNIEIISIISDLGRRLAEGELNQLSLVKDVILDENEYYEVIKKKTASLLSVCMKVGAISTNSPSNEVDMYSTLGEKLGMIFQMRDDIFDYYSAEVGKPTGNDIREGKVTLPLLYALDQSSEDEKKDYLRMISEADYTDENIEKLINFAIQKGGVEYTYSKIEEYRLLAVEIIDSVKKDEIREALHAVLDYIINRNH